MKNKPLRTTDIIISGILIINSLFIFLRFGETLINQVIFNIILAILLFTMSFSKKPSNPAATDYLIFYIRALIFILLTLLIIVEFSVVQNWITSLGK